MVQQGRQSLGSESYSSQALNIESREAQALKTLLLLPAVSMRVPFLTVDETWSLGVLDSP